MSQFLHLKLCLYYALQYLFFQYPPLIFFPNNSPNIKFSKELLRILVLSNSNENSLCPFKYLPKIKKKNNEIIIHEV